MGELAEGSLAQPKHILHHIFKHLVRFKMLNQGARVFAVYTYMSIEQRLCILALQFITVLLAPQHARESCP